MNPFWDRYAGFVERRRAVILLGALAVAAASAWCASRLDLRTDFAELLPRKANAVQELERLQKRLGGVSTLVVAIEGGDWKARETFAEEAVRALKQKLPPGHVTFIDYEIGKARAFYEKNQFLYADLKIWRRCATGSSAPSVTPSRKRRWSSSTRSPPTSSTSKI